MSRNEGRKEKKNGKVRKGYHFLRLVVQEKRKVNKAVFGCCKTFSGKGKCFHGVWLHCKKFSGKYFLVFGKEEGKHKSENAE